MVNYSYHKYVSDEVFISLILILFFQESLNRQSKSSFLFRLGVQANLHRWAFFVPMQGEKFLPKTNYW